MHKVDDFAPHCTTIVCCHVFEKSRYIRGFRYYEDGILECTCGMMDHSSDPKMWHVVGFSDLAIDDPTIMPLLEIEPGWQAERNSKDSPWQRTLFKDN